MKDSLICAFILSLVICEANVIASYGYPLVTESQSVDSQTEALEQSGKDDILSVKMVNGSMVIVLVDPLSSNNLTERMNIQAEFKLILAASSIDPDKIKKYKEYKINAANNGQEVVYKQDQTKTFVWRTIKERNAIRYHQMILGTYEQNTADCFMVHTFFGRLVFTDDLRLMSKALPHNSVNFFSTIGQNVVENIDFNHNFSVQINDTNYNLDHFEILTNPYNVPYKWVKSIDETVPAHAVGCSEEFEQVYYCGRMQVLDKGLFPAKIIDGVAYAHYFWVRSGADFEYLVYDY